MDESTEENENSFPSELNKIQRRVLGVLSEKAFTTPEYYPLTLKAVATGCNQKSNRSPVVSYTETDVESTLAELQTMGLTLIVHTAGGRTERYRHQIRHCLTVTEPQLAILTELLLRGKQQLGELRSRASRMVQIENQDQLRDELQGLIALSLVQSNGDLKRRGIDVDHSLYREREGMTMQQSAVVESAVSSETPSSRNETTAETTQEEAPSNAKPTEVVVSSVNQDDISTLQAENRELRERFEKLQTEVEEISRTLDDLRRDLGH